jgi:hypothetical protein
MGMPLPVRFTPRQAQNLGGEAIRNVEIVYAENRVKKVMR